jgi:acyl carrier protein phosphodiesterase
LDDAPPLSKETAKSVYDWLELSEQQHTKKAQRECLEKAKELEPKNLDVLMRFLLADEWNDAASRKYVRNRVTALLPFLLQKQNPQMHKLIHGVDVLSVEEWNRRYPGFTSEIL